MACQNFTLRDIRCGMAKKLTPAERAIKAMGGPIKAAATLGIDSPSVVFNWLYRGKVPAQWALQVAAASSVAASELRPDIFKDEGQAA